MKLKIRYKLILAITLLIVVLFASAALLFINEKKKELANDIYTNTLSFAQLSAQDIAHFYDLYLAQGSFVYFNRELKATLSQNPDVDAIQVVSYDGEVLYNSTEDNTQAYNGSPRLIEEENTLNQIQSEYISVKDVNGELYYLDSDLEGNRKFVNYYGKDIESFEDGTLFEYVVIPANEKYSLIYEITYENLQERILIITRRIIYLAILGVFIGIAMSIFMSGQITKPVQDLVYGAQEISKGNFKTRVDITSEDELGFLGQTFNQMAKDLEISMEARLYKERVTHELQLAKDIQDQLIPDGDEIPKVKGLDIVADIIPAEEIGGDMYDFLPIRDNKLLFYLGDVTGHGVPAGIVSSIASALFFGYANEPDIKKIVADVNKVLSAKTMPNMFMTLCLMQWDDEAGKFTYVSAGHEQLVHYKAAEGTAELTAAGGIALGMLPDVGAHLEIINLELNPGDYLVVYSDGIPEAWKNENEQYGLDRLVANISNFGKMQSSAAVKEAILNDLKNFTAGYKQMDDITIIVIRKT